MKIETLKHLEKTIADDIVHKVQMIRLDLENTRATEGTFMIFGALMAGTQYLLHVTISLNLAKPVINRLDDLYETLKQVHVDGDKSTYNVVQSALSECDALLRVFSNWSSE